MAKGFTTFLVVLFIVPALVYSLEPSRVKVVILPFRGGSRKYTLYLWKSFSSWFSVKPYRDVELCTVRERFKDGMKLSDIRKAFGADYAVRGELVTLKIFYGFFYSEIMAEGRVEIYDTLSCRKIFAVRKKVKERRGGLPYPILSIPYSVFRASTSLRDKVLKEVLDRLAKLLSGSIPDNLGRNLYLVQVGCFVLEENAEHKKRELVKKGYKTFIEDDGRFKKVIVGPIYDRNEAEKVAESLGGIVIY